MELTKIDEVEVKPVEPKNDAIQQLSELQLALIGGGIGDVVWG